MMAWQIWQVPTEKGKELSWFEEKQIGQNYDDKEAAELDKYLEWCDDPAPDKADYYRLELREVSGQVIA